jgi:uncharacterized protein (DUF1501 family)
MPALPTICTHDASRRAFLRRSSLLSMAAGAAPWALTLSAMGDAAAQTADDYKALVCVFLQGGNDNWNTLVPYDSTNHALYYGLRSNIAFSREALSSSVLISKNGNPDGRVFALAPNLGMSLLPLFHQGRMAVLHNVGTLVQPTTRAQYLARSVPLPPKLFSHNDQQSYWQASAAEGATTGWGGRMGDLFLSNNSTSTFTCINVTGNAVYLSGNTAIPYQVTTSGAVPVNGIKNRLFGSSTGSQVLRQFMTQSSTHWLANEHARVAQRSIEAGELITAALAGNPSPVAFPTDNRLADQLSMVARLISARNSLGTKRQVFFVSLGGFDTHDNQVNAHAALMTNLGDALAAFYRATEALGIASQVTTFTATDFGRTLVSNDDGTDHGWGSSQFVIGGAVKGGGFVGAAPLPANNGPDDVGQGRLLPSIAVEQYACTLGSWFGISATDLALVLPRLTNFSERDLGFMVGSSVGASTYCSYTS